MLKFRNPFNFDTDVSSSLCGFVYDPISDRTQQHFKAETDINTLVKVYTRTGEVPGADFPAFEFDATGVVDYQSAMNSLIAADRSFAALPAIVRDRFGNDPAKLIAFVSDEANRGEAISLGLVPKPVDVVPVVPPIVEGGS